MLDNLYSNKRACKINVTVVYFGTEWAPQYVALMSIGTAFGSFVARCNTRNIFTSVSSSKPYPLFTSAVVVPNTEHTKIVNCQDDITI